MKSKGYIQLISSVEETNNSVLELHLLPGEKTPWHYHTLFSETFEVLKGSLEIGKGREIFNAKPGDMVTIDINERHYYHNVSDEECTITTTIVPGNKNFERALFILKGLGADGLASAAGTPSRFSDLVLFVYLSNSKMLGVQKLAEPIFNFLAKAAIKKGRLNQLIRKYCQ